jgi:uncharacterized MAPEG superfamily protein
MTIALWCVLIAALLPYLATGIAKFATDQRYDNRDPRAFLDRQSGMAKRADNAQKNGFEAFPFFAAAVLVAQMLEASQERLDILAIIFIAARVAYLGFYLADMHAARSIAWLIGIVACMTIFVLPA